jgi:hypothetical protein
VEEGVVSVMTASGVDGSLGSVDDGSELVLPDELPEPVELVPEPVELVPEPVELVPAPVELSPEPDELLPVPLDEEPAPVELSPPEPPGPVIPPSGLLPVPTPVVVVEPELVE